MRSPIRRLAVPLTGFIAALALLNGCTNGLPQAADTSPTPSAAASGSTTATATPTPTRTGPLTTGPNVRPGEKPPTLPPDARTHDTSGAMAAGFAFFRALDWSIATNDPSLLIAMSSNNCAPCQAAIDEFIGLTRLRHTLKGGRIRIESWGLAPGHYTVKADEVVRVGTKQEAEEIEDAHGKVVHSYPAREDTSLVFLDWILDHWQVVDLGGAK